MIQGAINQLLLQGAVAKKASEARDRRISREETARKNALTRAQDRIKAKADQNENYKRFLESLDAPNAPEQLKRIAYEEHLRRQNSQVRIGGQNIDINRLSPEAQAAIMREGSK